MSNRVTTWAAGPSRRCNGAGGDAGCAGFVDALAQAWGAIATGVARRVLIVGSDAFTRLIDWTDRNTCVLFGDGAGAAVVTGTDDPAFRPYFTLHSDGSGADAVL